jgi:hypothetical protein
VRSRLLLKDLELGRRDPRLPATAAEPESEQHNLVESAFIFREGHAFDRCQISPAAVSSWYQISPLRSRNRGCCELITTILDVAFDDRLAAYGGTRRPR